MLELYWEYLFLRCIWLYVLIISRTRSSPVAATETSDIAAILSKEFIDIQATVECRFTLKRISDMISTYSQIYGTDKYSQHSSII